MRLAAKAEPARPEPANPHRLRAPSAAAARHDRRRPPSATKTSPVRTAPKAESERALAARRARSGSPDCTRFFHPNGDFFSDAFLFLYFVQPPFSSPAFLFAASAHTRKSGPHDAQRATATRLKLSPAHNYCDYRPTARCARTSEGRRDVPRNYQGRATLRALPIQSRQE